MQDEVAAPAQHLEQLVAEGELAGERPAEPRDEPFAPRVLRQRQREEEEDGDKRALRSAGQQRVDPTDE